MLIVRFCRNVFNPCFGVFSDGLPGTVPGPGAAAAVVAAAAAAAGAGASGIGAGGAGAGADHAGVFPGLGGAASLAGDANEAARSVSC